MAITTTTATTPDYDEIVRVVQLYIDGWKGDVTKFKEAFHKGYVRDRCCWRIVRKPVYLHIGPPHEIRSSGLSEQSAKNIYPEHTP